MAMRGAGGIGLGWLLAVGVGALAAQEPSESMLGAAEAALEQPPGPWQGNWRLRREHPGLRTRGAAELLRLQILQDLGEDQVSLQWVAGRAICPEPEAAPCEWVGAAGETTAWIGPTGLYALLPVSADAGDPFLLHLDVGTPPGLGVLFSGKGEVRYSLRYERLEDDSGRRGP